MTPYYEHAGVTIYHGDCRELMPGLADQMFDVAFADPPYGVGLQYGADYSDKIGHADIASQLCRVSSVALVTPGIRNLIDWPRPAWVLCWAKPGSTRRSDLGGFNEWEPILMYGKRKLYHDLRLLPTAPNLSTGTGDHPCPKPLNLLRWLLAECTTGGPVFDPFMGSGTTLRAAKDLGLRAVGVDIEERYCETAARRLGQEVFDLESTLNAVTNRRRDPLPRITVLGHWHCGYTDLKWEGDISDHHGLPPGIACPGPHLRVTDNPHSTEHE